MNWYKHYMGDFARDTAHLTILQHGVYRLLLDHYYATEKPLQADILALQRIIRATTPDEQDAIKTVLKEFFTLKDGFYHNDRADRELAKYELQAEHNREVGRKGGRPRNPEITQVVSENNPSGFDSLENKTQVVSKQKPKDNPNETLTHKPINPLTNEPIIDIPSDKPKKKTVMKTLPADFGISDQVRKWAIENNHHNLEVHLDRFIEYVKSNGKKYADWDSAFKRAIREDWGKVNKPVYQNNGYQTAAQRTANEQDVWRKACEQSQQNEIDVTPHGRYLNG